MRKLSRLLAWILCFSMIVSDFSVPVYVTGTEVETEIVETDVATEMAEEESKVVETETAEDEMEAVETETAEDEMEAVETETVEDEMEAVETETTEEETETEETETTEEESETEETEIVEEETEATETESTEELQQDEVLVFEEGETGDNTEPSNAVTRIEWLAALTDVFEMSVEEDNYPDNYYSDINATSEYYYDVMLATEFGLIDVEAGDPLKPDDAATREFAAHTLNLCMGYFLEGEIEYTFSEADSVTYPEDIQIAINKGWFELFGNDFLPEQGITQDEKIKLITEAEKVVASVVIDESYEDWYQLAEGVIVVPEETEILLSEENELTLYNCTTQISAGDIFVVFADGFPLARKAVAVTTTDTEMVITVEDVEMEDAFTELEAQGTIAADLTQAQAIDEDVQLSYIVGGTSEKAFEDGTMFYSLDEVGEQEVSAVVATKSIARTDGRLRAGLEDHYSIKIKITNVKADYKVSIVNKQAYLKVSGKVTFSFNGGTGDMPILGLEESFVRIPIAGIGYFKPALEGCVKGEVALSMKSNLSAGVEWTEKNGIRLSCDFKKEAFTIQAEAEAKVGVKVAVGADVGFINAELFFEAGGKAFIKVTTHTDEKLPRECKHVAAHLYATVGGKVELKLIIFKQEVSIEQDLIDEKNSPVKVALHYEDGKPVSVCSRDEEEETEDGGSAGGGNGGGGGGAIGSTKKYKYYTPIDSQYAYSGANTGVSSTGETYTIFGYSLNADNQATITKYNGNVSALNIPSTIDGYTVVGIGNDVFKNNTRLMMVNIPDTVTSIGNNAFASCSNLGDVTLSKNLVSIGYSAFYNCDSLTSIEIPKSLDRSTTSSWSENHGAFRACDNLKEVIFEEGTMEVTAWLFANCPGIEEIEIPNTVTIIESQAFYNCSNLKQVTFSNILESIEGNAFEYCASLEEALLPDTITNMGTYVFDGCTSLKKVTLPNTRINIMEGTFRNCSSLTSIELPSTVQNIRKYAFQGSGLEEIILPENALLIEEYAFQNNDALVKVEMGDKLTTIGNYAFNDCALLADVDLSNALTTIGQHTFQNCDSLALINIPNSVTSIGIYAFENCEVLAEVTMGTGLTRIPAYAFNLCPALNNIVLPYRVDSIIDNAFTNCTSLTEITIPRATTSIGSNAFSYPTKMNVYGVAGTYAETWAQNVGATFVNKEVKATGVTLEQENLTVYKGKSVALKAIIEPEGVTDVISWRSSDTGVVTVSDLGVVKAVGVGSATVRVTVGDYSASCKVAVVQPITSIGLNKTSLSMEGLAAYQLTATIYPSNAHSRAVEWTSSNEAVATVDVTGKVIAVSKGSATITVAALDGSGITRSCNVTVVNNGYRCETPEAMESPHNYAVNCNDFWIYTVENAYALQVTFDERTNLEEDFDYLYIYNANGEQVGKYTGTELAGKTIEVLGKTVKMKLDTDEAGTAWGFKVVNIAAVFAPLTEPKANITSGSEVVAGSSIVLSSDEESNIYYTTDGSTPTAESTLYTEPIVLTEDVTIKAIAVKNGYANSPVAEFTYKVLQKYVVTFDCNGGSSEVVDKEVYYGKNYGELPTPIRAGYRFDGWYTEKDAGTLVKADSVVEIKENHTLYAHWAEMTQLTAPTASIPTTSKVEAGTEVSLSCSVEGASIYYTLDGTEPTIESSLYTEPIELTESITIKAIAVKNGYWNSEAAEFVYYVSDHADEVVDTGSCGKKATWTLYGDGTLKITGTGKMDDFEYYSPWYDEYSDIIKRVEIGKGITYVGAWSFYSHYALKSVTFSSTVKTIGDSAFYGADQLAQINDFEKGLLRVPETVENIYDNSFSSTGFTDVYLGGNLKEVGVDAFEGLELDTFTIQENIGNFVLGNSYGSFSCDTLCIGEGVTAEWWQTKYRYKSTGVCFSTGNIEDAVQNSIVVDSNNPEMCVRNEILCLRNDTGYTLYSVPSNIGFLGFPSDINITEIGQNVFNNANVSGVLVIPDTVTKIGGGAFGDCDNLTEVILPSGLVSLGHIAFAGCDNLTKVNIPKSLENNIRVDSSNFRCFQDTPLRDVTFEEGITKLPAGLFHSCLLSSITIPDTVVELEDNVFRYCENLTSIELPEGVKTIGYYCFSDSGLKTAVLPSTIKTVKDSFWGLELERLTVKSKDKINFMGDGYFNIQSIHGYPYTYVHDFAAAQEIPFYDIETGELCEKLDYFITYELDGGVNNPANPIGYKKGEVITLLEPTKDGVEFGGWFLANGRKITSVSGQNVTVYAKWFTGENLWVEDIDAQTYTGKAIKPQVEVYDGDVLLEEKKDYTVTYKNNTKAAGNGAAKNPPSIVITGKGNYSGKETVTFTIAAKDIGEDDITVTPILLKYNKKIQKPVPVLKYNGKNLKNKTDFTIEYPDLEEGAYKEAGIYTILLKGKGNFTGEREVTFTITENTLMSKVTVAKVKNQQYTGEEIIPELTVKNGKILLEEGIDYTVTFENNVEIGTATAILTGVGDYSGEKKVTFKISGRSISKAKITGVPKSVVYTGEAITIDSEVWGEEPVLTMTINKEKRTLEEGIDYTISYLKNTNKGTATIVFTGIKGYSGTLKKTFKITAYDMKKNLTGMFDANVEEVVVYAKGGSKPKPEVTFEGTVLVEGKDYTLSYKNNTKVNDGSNPKKLPTVTIKGKGNFSGSVSLNYTIEAQSLSEMAISVPDKTYANKKNAYKSTPKLVDLDGKALKAGTDYEKALVYSYRDETVLADGTIRNVGEAVGANDIVPAGTVIVVTATGKGNYLEGTTVQGEYRITKASITSAKVQIPTQIYTGEEICPDKDEITIKVGKATLEDTDYEIVNYENNISKGKAQVTIKGVGNYGGTKTITFTIKAKGFLWWWR